MTRPTTRRRRTPFRIGLAIASLLTPLPLSSAQDEADETIVVREILIADASGRAGRSPVFTDPIEARLAAGTWSAPKEGDLVEGDRRERRWTRSVSEDGRFGDRALSRGYAWAEVESPRERVMLLDARGYRHVYVNGEPRGGDIYNLGLVRWPVALRAGSNGLLFRGGRGQLQVRLEPPPAPVFLEPRDALIPQVLRGEADLLWGMVQVTNATTGWQSGIVLRATTDTGHRDVAVPALGPASAARVAFRFSPPRLMARLRLELLGTPEPAPALDLGLTVRDPGEKHVRTFPSAIDGSVQAYGVTPPKRTDAERPLGLVLSLHGAGVDGRNQAHHYRPTDWAYIVSPTNRRPFGFDWEDWGRWDALEALADAKRRFGTDPRYTVLTGHSMGGHGTWQLGVHFPDRFAAIGPSAGWRDFWSYAGAADAGDESDAVNAILTRSVNGSRTTLLERNLQERGVYVLHGDRDDNVPVSQARFMRQRLGELHPNFVYYERPGAGHWWGDQCMDWPPLMEFLRQNTPLPATADVRTVDFRTVHPSISSQLHWITIEAQERDFEVARVHARLDGGERELEIETENVARFYVDVHPLAHPDELGEDEVALPAGEPVGVRIDGQDMGVLDWPEPGSPEQVVASGVYRFARTGDRWSVAGRPSARLKGPHRAGPFKDAFRNDVLLVAGTQGDDAEDAWAYAKARHDAETFTYRGNGAFEILRDVDVDLEATRDRNLILYGNADTHALWDDLIGDCPVNVQRGAVAIGDQILEGDDLGCLLLFPKKGSETASVGVVAGTGPAGQAVTNQLPYFVSGVAYPDWIVIGTEMLELGFEGVRAAGFFAEDWTLGQDWAIRSQAQR